MRSHLKNRCWVDYAKKKKLLTEQSSINLRRSDKITKSKPYDNCVNFFEMNYKYKKKNRRKKEIAPQLEFGC